MSKKKPKAPPPPPAPDYGTLWKQYSSWTAQAAANRDRTISDSRARLGAAGASDDVIKAMEADATKEYDSKMKEYQSGSTYKLLQEGYDIARGAKANIYSGKAQGKLYSEAGDFTVNVDNAKVNDLTKALRNTMGGKGEGAAQSRLNAAKKGTTVYGGPRNTMEQFYASGYESGDAEVDAKAEARKKVKLQAGGAGGEEVVTGYDISSDTPGANPWVA